MKYVYVGQRGNKLLVRNIGQYPENVSTYPYKLYEVTGRQTPFRTWDDTKYLEPREFDTINEMKKWRKEFTGIHNFPLYGQTDPVYQYISSAYPSDMTVDIHDYFVCTLDIETARDETRGYAKPSDPFCPVLSIQLKDSRSGKFIVFTYGKDYVKPDDADIDIDFRSYADETEMMKEFLYYWAANHPDIMTGWNTTMYDIPYLTNRIMYYLFPGDEKKVKYLSPFGNVYKRNVKDQFDNEEETYVWTGIVHLDYMILYKKFTYNARESYTLNNIAYVELGEKKVDYSEMNNLQELYEKDFSKWVYYGAKDTDLVSKLDAKLRFIELITTLAYRIGCNIEDVYSAVKSWTVFIANELRKDKKIVPCEKEPKRNYRFVGAYVKEIKAGRYNWVKSFDLASLYPHIQMELNISPEMIVEDDMLPQELLDIRQELGTTLQGIQKIIHEDVDLSALKDYDMAMSPSGQFYDIRKEGFFPKILKAMYNERTTVKRLQLKKEQEYEDTKDESLPKEITALKAKQMAIKILINSGYGALANKYFFWTDTRNAESITSMGQVAIQWIEKHINKYLDKVAPGCKVIYSDTDSVYIHLDKLVQKHFDGMDDLKIVQALEKFGNEKIQPVIDEGYERLSDYLNGYEQTMKMKMEVIAPRAIWIQKKRYLMAKLYDEGVLYHEPKIKMMGVDAVKSSTPEICRKALKESIDMVLLHDEATLQEYVSKFKEEFFAADADHIAFPRSVNGLAIYADDVMIWKKRTPIAVRGALVFNHWKEKLDIQHTEAIKPSDKVKFFYMIEPNLYNSNILAFVSGIPSEFPEVRIDYKTQFYKSFLKPLEAIMNAVGWEYEKKNTLLSFFD